MSKAKAKSMKPLSWLAHMAYNITPPVLEKCLIDEQKNKDKEIDWSIICQSEQIPESYWEENMERFLPKIDWKSLAKNKKLSSKFWRKYFGNLPYFYDLFANENLDNSFWLDIVESLSKEQYELLVYCLANSALHLTEFFFRNIKIVPNIAYLVQNKNISDEFFKEKYGLDSYEVNRLKEKVIVVA